MNKASDSFVSGVRHGRVPSERNGYQLTIPALGGADMANYYEVLGVGRNATEKEIRQAYRKLARQYHPDVNKTDADAEGKFKEINEAYGVLSDEESRKKYDAYGDNWKHADQYEHSRGSTAGGTRWTFRDGGEVFSGFGGGSSIFEDLFSSGRASRGSATRRPRPTEQRVEITLEEAYHGTTRTVRTHDGRNLEVKIPAGVNDGSRVHVSPNGSQGNDFYLVVSVWDHPKFRREDTDLFTEIELPVDDAVLGY